MESAALRCGAAIAFFEALGGRQAGAYADPGPMWRSQNLLCVWDDIAALIAAAGG